MIDKKKQDSIERVNREGSLRLSFKMHAEDDVVKIINKQFDTMAYIKESAVIVDAGYIPLDSKEFKSIPFLIEVFMEYADLNKSTFCYWDRFNNMVTYLEEGKLNIVAETRPKGIEAIIKSFGPVDEEVIVDDLELIFNNEDRDNIVYDLLLLNNMMIRYHEFMREEKEKMSVED
ncbi:MAG: hypothetical protein ACRC7N_16780 [Clostridium sp.]